MGYFLLNNAMSSRVNLSKPHLLALTSAVIIVALLVLGTNGKPENDSLQPATPPPVLSVAMTQAQQTQLPLRVPATGNIAAWQEAIISAESDGLKLIDVNANVGDSVKRGQLLARFNADIVTAELAEAVAAVAQAEAVLMEAELNFARAKSLQISRAISTQQLDQTHALTMTARARLDAAHAQEKKNRLRVEQTNVRAPSDGIISSRTATIGTVIPSAQELFRLIENNRLEWRALVAAAAIEQLTPGQTASITLANAQTLHGIVRTVAPTIDSRTHTGLVYIDLPPHAALHAGAFMRGYIEVNKSLALTLPQRALTLRDGFHYVMQVDANSIVKLKKVTTGRQIDDRIEIVSGLKLSEPVIASGLDFLSEGDAVQIVDAVSIAGKTPGPTSAVAQGKGHTP